MMLTNGYYRMERGWHENEIFGDEPYCRRAAWEWLISEAAWRPRPSRGIGQLKHSLRFLAKAWNWSIGRVQRFLKTLVRENMIRIQMDSEGKLKRMLITICNYDRYQCCWGSEDEPERADGFAPAAPRFQPESKQRKAPNGASPPKSPSRNFRDSGQGKPGPGLAPSPASEPAAPAEASGEAPAPGRIEEEFAAWIGHYPHRVALPEAMTAFAVARRSASLAELSAGAERYAQSLMCPNAPAPMNPARWLRRMRWRDEPFVPLVIAGGAFHDPSARADQPRRKSPHEAMFDAFLAVGAARKRQNALSGRPRTVLGSLP